MFELEPPHQRQLLTEALRDLVVIGQETQCSPETVRRLEMLHKCIMFDTIEGLRGRGPFGGGHASYLRVLLSMALLTRSTVLALSINDKDKGRIPDALEEMVEYFDEVTTEAHEWNMGHTTSSSHRYASSDIAAARMAFVPLARV
ncbi:hypothetical protein B0A53_00969 [Rhodotorula sp. CCFEE 5036]|nr:hypothetical protein B0A53_00969 [Rhodotorula sp. CCFEE 5036]